MRILYHHRIASRDGQLTHIEEMVGALRECGHDVEVCAPRFHEQDSGRGGSAGWVGTLKATLPKPVYELAELTYSTVAYRRLCRAIETFRPDAIYERYALFNPSGVWASREYRVPMLLEVNAPYAVARRKYNGLRLGWLADRCEAYTWRSATRVFPVTEVLAQIIERAGVPRSRMRVIPNAVDPTHYDDLPSPEDAKRALGLAGRTVIGFTGFVREWDRLDRVLTWIAASPPVRSLHLLIVGDGPARRELEAQARSLGISDRLTFTGVVPRIDVPRLAVAFDIALQTALVPYASPLCLFEYLALGKPIVAPDQPNHHEVLRAGIDALLYDPDEPCGMEQAIERLVADAGLRRRLAEGAGGSIAARGYTWRKNAERVTEELLRLLPERAKSGAQHH